MAKKTTYLYKVKMWRGSGLSMTDYCYARNAAAAVDGMKGIYRHEKYDHFETVCFAEADYELHPDLFAQITAEELKTIEKNKLATADKYARRKDNKPVVPEGAEFVSREEMEKMLL